MRLLHIVGIVFAVFGISGAVNLFNAKSMADIASAQQDRKTSNRVSFTSWPCIQNVYCSKPQCCTCLQPCVLVLHQLACNIEMPIHVPQEHYLALSSKHAVDNAGICGSDGNLHCICLGMRTFELDERTWFWP